MRRYSCQVKSSKVRCHKLLRGGLRRNKIGKALSWSKAGNCGSFSTFTMRILTLVGVFSSEKPLLQKTQTFFHIKWDQSLWSLFWREKKRPKKREYRKLIQHCAFPVKNRYNLTNNVTWRESFAIKSLPFFIFRVSFFSRQILSFSVDFSAVELNDWVSVPGARCARLEFSFVNKQFLKTWNSRTKVETR